MGVASGTGGAHALRGILRQAGHGLRVFGYAFGLTWAAIFFWMVGLGKAWKEAAVGGFGPAVLVGVVLALLHCAEIFRRRWKKLPNTGQSEETLGSRGLVLPVGYLILGLFVFAVRVWNHGLTLPVEQLPAADPAYSYGPADANDLDLVLAPGVSVDILPSAASLGGRRFEEFDVSPGGSVVVRDEARLLDLVSGREVADVPAGVHSFAFFGDALTLVTEEGELGYVEDGVFHGTGRVPSQDTRLAASSERSRLLLYRDAEGASAATAAIVSLPANRPAEALSGAPGAIGAVGGDAIQTFYAQGRSLYRLAAPGQAQLLFTLPDEGSAIIGILVAGESVYFATRRAVYMLYEGLALPLAIGVGGALRAHGADLYLLDASHGRVFRISRNRRAGG